MQSFFAIYEFTEVIFFYQNLATVDKRGRKWTVKKLLNIEKFVEVKKIKIPVYKKLRATSPKNYEVLQFCLSLVRDPKVTDAKNLL